jgi:hypothetical protein
MENSSIDMFTESCKEYVKKMIKEKGSLGPPVVKCLLKVNNDDTAIAFLGLPEQLFDDSLENRREFVEHMFGKISEQFKNFGHVPIATAFISEAWVRSYKINEQSGYNSEELMEEVFWKDLPKKEKLCIIIECEEGVKNVTYDIEREGVYIDMEDVTYASHEEIEKHTKSVKTELVNEDVTEISSDSSNGGVFAGLYKLLKG